jgi:hypothetical protein
LPVKLFKTLAKVSSFNLKHHEIAVEEIHRNLVPSALYQQDRHVAGHGKTNPILEVYPA